MSGKRSYLQYIARYKRNSVFSSILLILAALTIFIAGTFYVYAENLLNRHVKEKLYQSTASSLVNTSQTLDSLLSQILVKTTSFMKNKDVIEATVAPNELNYAQNKSVVEQISAIVQSDALIKSFYYYIPSNETIYASENNITSYLSFFHFDKRAVTDAYRHGDSAADVELGRDLTARVQMVDGALYLYYAFPVTNLLGLAAIELNPEILMQCLYGSDPAGGEGVYIYDRRGSPILADNIEYPALTLPEEIEPLSTWERDGATNYLYQAESTGWKYVYVVPNDSLRIKENIKPGTIIPFLLLLMAAGLFCAFLITGRVYKPIHHLLLNITRHMDEFGSDGQDDAKNEFDYFEMAYENIVKKARWFMELTANMTPAILERMFDNIFHNTCPDDQYVERTLESVNYPFELTGYCVALVGEIQHENGILVTEKERRICWDSVSGVVGGCVPDGKTFAYTDRNGRYICVVQFPREISFADTERRTTQLMAGVNNVLKQQPFTVLSVSGSACTSIKDIGASYQEARQGLKNIHGFRVSVLQRAHPSQEETPVAVYLPVQAQLKQRVAYLMQIATEGNREKAEDFAVRMVKDLVSYSEAADAGEHLHLFVDELMDHVSHLNLDDRPLQQMQGQLRLCIDQAGEDAERLERHMTAFCIRVLELLENSNNKMSLRHIQRVREYIHSHYADSTLSLHGISEHIGLTPSYLSRLLNEHLQQGFNSYVNRIRVEKAKELLYRTNLSSAAVCRQTGFNSVQNFNRVFKRHTGMTPGEFRVQKPEEGEGSLSSGRERASGDAV